MINIADFRKLELKTARVIEVKPHPDADRLWILTVDVGEAETRTVVAGIKEHYTGEDLAGKSVILVSNLEPAVIRGVSSGGMILAAKDGQTLSIVTTDRPVPPGAKVA